MRHTFWALWEKRSDCSAFRRESDYLAQLDYGGSLQAFKDTYLYLRGVAPDLLDLFEDDDAFGAITLDIDGKVVTRDLLDSVAEIHFLRTQLYLQPGAALRILDVGAGYGRFAHRFLKAYPQYYVYCADAIPVSTQVCKEYLKYRKVERAEALFYTELSRVQKPIDLAVNVHSWSECTLEWIGWWMDQIGEFGIPNLFLVPHDGQCTAHETFNESEPQLSQRLPFLPLIQQRGYLLRSSASKFPKSFDGLPLFPTQYYLFQL